MHLTKSWKQLLGKLWEGRRSISARAKQALMLFFSTSVELKFKLVLGRQMRGL